MNKSKVILVMTPSKFKDDLLLRLSQSGFEVLVTKNRVEAFNNIRKNSYDAIITQSKLMESDCIEFILGLRDIKMDIPILVINFDNCDVEREILTAGASVVIQLPEKTETIIELLNSKLKARWF